MLLQSFLASALNFQSHSTMKSTIFSSKYVKFSLSFQLNLCNLIFKVFFRLDSKELSRELGDPFFELRKGKISTQF